MHILVTNDDGVNAPGLLALAQAMRKLGDVTVLAPDRNWSASGHTKTLHRPLRVKETALADGSPAMMTDGAPSDCVALAVLGLVKTPIDFVVSGINPNANIGHDVTYSGTVTAALEAAIWGLRGLAFSLDTPEGYQGTVDFEPAAEMARRVTAAAQTNRLPANIVLNVNIPYLPLDEMGSMVITRQGQRIYRDELVTREDPRGRPYYWIGGLPPTGVPEEGTDFGALTRGQISITPLHLDLTAHQEMETIQSWNWD
jgi:5'-nucleotidase